MAFVFRRFSLKLPSTPPAYFFFSTLCRRSKKPIDPFALPLQPPPLSKKVPFEISLHGRTWQDPYHWMSNTSDPDFKRYLELENSYSQSFMADTEALQRTLYEEMTSRMAPRVSTPPERWGPWLYYQCIPEGKEFPVLCRRLETESEGWLKVVSNYLRRNLERDEILLDWNEVAEKYGYFHIGTCRISPDHNFLAYTLDTTGSESFTLHIKDLRSGLCLPNLSSDGVVSLAWGQDSRALFYTTSDDGGRPYRVFCKKLGSHAASDVLIFTETDSSFCVDITSTKDGRFLTVNSNSRTSSEVYIIDATKPQDGLQRIHQRAPGVQYFLEHHVGYFYVLTNAPLRERKFSCGHYYLAMCRVEDIQSASWQNIILPGRETSLQDMDILNGYLVLFGQKKGSQMICSINLPANVTSKHRMQIDDLDPWYFPLPSNTCSIAPGSNLDFMSLVYRVVLSSPVIPDVIVDYNVSERNFSIVQQDEVLGVSLNAKSGFLSKNLTSSNPRETQSNENDRSQNIELHSWEDFSDTYSCERVEVRSYDGVEIPLTILFSLEAWQEGHSPGLLYGYGAYGEVLDKSWDADHLSLLNRGWVVAFADVRGGDGGCVSSWHQSGSGLQKLNSIYDFLSCAEYLVSKGYVHQDQLAAIGHSAGGLLVGAAINMYPQLFSSVILKVPFLDVCNTLLDPSLPLTKLDYEEFGNPQIKSHFDSILSYSPYDNISQGSCYPSVLIKASFHDSRVGVWEAAKWIAKVRNTTCQECSKSIIMNTDMNGGHFKEGGRFTHCMDTAYEFAFLIKVLRLSDSIK